MTHSDTLEMQNGHDSPKPKSTQLIQKEEIENTPFHVVGSEELGFFITIGNVRLTDPQKTMEEAYNMLDNHTWQIITNLIISLVYKILEEHDRSKKINEELKNI